MSANRTGWASTTVWRRSLARTAVPGGAGTKMTDVLLLPQQLAAGATRACGGCVSDHRRTPGRQPHARRVRHAPRAVRGASSRTARSRRLNSRLRPLTRSGTVRGPPRRHRRRGQRDRDDVPARPADRRTGSESVARPAAPLHQPRAGHHKRSSEQSGDTSHHRCRRASPTAALAVRGSGPGPQRPLRRRSAPLDPSSGHVAAPVLVAGKWRKQQASATRDVQAESGGVPWLCLRNGSDRAKASALMLGLVARSPGGSHGPRTTRRNSGSASPCRIVHFSVVGASSSGRLRGRCRSAFPLCTPPAGRRWRPDG